MLSKHGIYQELREKTDCSTNIISMQDKVAPSGCFIENTQNRKNGKLNGEIVHTKMPYSCTGMGLENP